MPPDTTSTRYPRCVRRNLSAARIVHRPLCAQAVGLIAGAFIIALATILIYFILIPGKRLQSGKARRIEGHTPVHAVVPASPHVPANESTKSLASTIANA
jgi:hypothetical protein